MASQKYKQLLSADDTGKVAVKKWFREIRHEMG